MNPKERISVAMATYNGERFISEQLNSLACQTRSPDELVVGDDCSTDGTCQILHDFAASAPFPVRVLASEQNHGSNHNFERVFRQCQGDIIFPSDQDDIWMPGKIEQMAAALARYPSADLAISNSEVIDEDARPMGINLYLKKLPQQERFYERGAGAMDLVLANWLCAGHTMAFRRKPAMINLIEELNISYNYDDFRAIFAAAYSGIAVIPHPLTKYRRHRTQQTYASELTPTRLQRLRNLIFNADRSIASRAQFSQRMSQVCGPLLAHGADPGAIRILAGRAAIAAFQANLPQSRFIRIAPIVANLLTGRYHSFANGISTAMRDFFVPARTFE